MTLSTAQRQALSWTALCAGLAAVLWLLAPVLTPFVIASGLAYVLHPLVDRLARLGVPRLLAVVLVEFAALLLGLALVLLVVPVLARELPLIQVHLPQMLDRLDHSLEPLLAGLGLKFSLNIEALKAWLSGLFDSHGSDWASAAMHSARIGGSALLSVLGNAVLVPVVLFYLLADWSNLVARAQGLVPPRLRPTVHSFLGECDTMLGQYLRGQVLVMVLMALFYSAGLALARFELALPLGVFTGLAIAVPYVGFGIGLVLSLLAALLQFGSLVGVASVVAVYALGQVLEGFFLTPRLVGERIGLSPLAVIFALLAFGQLFGFVGVLIALPASAVTVVALRRARTAYLSSRLYLG